MQESFIAFLQHVSDHALLLLVFFHLRDNKNWLILIGTPGAHQPTDVEGRGGGLQQSTHCQWKRRNVSRWQPPSQCWLMSTPQHRPWGEPRAFSVNHSHRQSSRSNFWHHYIYSHRHETDRPCPHQYGGPPVPPVGLSKWLHHHGTLPTGYATLCSNQYVVIIGIPGSVKPDQSSQISQARPELDYIHQTPVVLWECLL